MRKTKIICTLGPASDSDAVIGDLMLAGADIFRLNMSHARHDWVRDVVKRIRRIAMGLDVNCAILLPDHAWRGKGRVARNSRLKSQKITHALPICYDQSAQIVRKRLPNS